MSSLQQLFKQPFKLVKENKDFPFNHTYETEEVEIDSTYNEILELVKPFLHFIIKKHKKEEVEDDNGDIFKSNFNLFISNDLDYPIYEIQYINMFSKCGIHFEDYYTSDGEKIKGKYFFRVVVDIDTVYQRIN